LPPAFFGAGPGLADAGVEVRVDQLSHHVQGLVASEVRQRLPVSEQDDGRKAPQLVVAGEPHVLVHLDLGQQETASVLHRQALEGGPKRSTGWTPLGPEINEHEALPGGLDHTLLECLLADVNDVGGISKTVFMSMTVAIPMPVAVSLSMPMTMPMPMPMTVLVTVLVTVPVTHLH